MGTQTASSNAAPSISGLLRRGYLPPWLSGYALIGLVVSGIVPVLLPLTVDPKGAIAVGLVVASFYLGMLIAPLFGALADRTGAHRSLFLASFPVAAAGSLGIAYAHETWQMALCIFVVGAAAGAAQTIASMFIVEGRPAAEWPDRLGWMRLAFGTGQAVGLAVSAYFAHKLQSGWIVVAVLLTLGLVGGAVKLPRIATTPKPATPRTSTGALAGVRQIVVSRFGLFLGCWSFAMLGLMTFYNVVPLVLKDSFGTDPRTSSLVFLVGSAIGAVVYPLSGRLSGRVGPGRVLAVGLTVTLLAFLVLASATFDHGALGAVLGSGCLIVIASAYPLQYIGATILAARIAPGGEGSAMGLFNSGVAAGAIIGALVPSLLAREAGYRSLTWFSLGALIVSALFGFVLAHRLRHSAVSSR